MLYQLSYPCVTFRGGLFIDLRLHESRCEFPRCRIDHAKTLLLETDLRISQIAALSGFSGMMYFSSIFKQAVGFGPRE